MSYDLTPPTSMDDLLFRQQIAIQEGMTLAYMTSIPSRVLSSAIEKICQSSAITELSCEIIAGTFREKIAAPISSAIQAMTPQIVQSKVSSIGQEVSRIVSTMPQFYHEKYGIPENQTKEYLESMHHNLTYVATWGAGRVLRALRSKTQPNILETNPSEFQITGTPQNMRLIFAHRRSVPEAPDYMDLKVTPLNNNSLFVFTDYLSASPIAPNPSIIFSAMRAIKDLGVQHNAKDIYLSFQPANKRLFSIIKKRLQSTPNLSVEGLASYIDEPTFKISLACITASSSRKLSKFTLAPELFLHSPINLTLLPVTPSNQALLSFKPIDISNDPFYSTNPIDAIEPSINPIVFEELSHKIVNLARDLTGIVPAVDQARELKDLFAQIYLNPQVAPQAILNKFYNGPKEIFQRILSIPSQNCPNMFLNDPGASSLIGLASGVFSICSLANEILPVVERISHDAVRNPLKLPVTISKELVQLTFNKITAVVQLGKEFIKNPLKTGEHIVKSVITSPVILFNNIKQLFGFGKKRNYEAEEAERRAAYLRWLKWIRAVEQREKKENQDAAIAASNCYHLAKKMWMRHSQELPESYCKKLVYDFKEAVQRQRFSLGLPYFITTIQEHFEEGNLFAVHELSPTAHPRKITMPPEISVAFQGLVLSSLRFQVAIMRLDHEIIGYGESIQQKVVAVQELKQANEELHGLINNEEIIKKLRLKLKIKGCQ